MRGPHSRINVLIWRKDLRASPLYLVWPEWEVICLQTRKKDIIKNRVLALWRCSSQSSKLWEINLCVLVTQSVVFIYGSLSSDKHSFLFEGRAVLPSFCFRVNILGKKHIYQEGSAVFSISLSLHSKTSCFYDPVWDNNY
jgi:hypothetical protein